MPEFFRADALRSRRTVLPAHFDESFVVFGALFKPRDNCCVLVSQLVRVLVLSMPRSEP